MKLFKQITLVVILSLLAYGIYYLSQALPIIGGYGAKNLCSCVFVAGRDPKQVIAQELGTPLVNLGTYEVHYEDSSATASVFGLSKRKAIYRKGLGCTLVSEIDEEELRKQKIRPLAKPVINQDTIAWPMGDKIIDTLKQELTELSKVVASAFEEPDTVNPVNTRAVIVLHNGKIVAEKYASGFTKDTKLIGWSMTKTITNAIVGVLVKQGKLNVNAVAPVE